MQEKETKSFIDEFLDQSTPVDGRESADSLNDGQEQPTPVENQPVDTKTQKPDEGADSAPVAKVTINGKEVPFYEGEDGVPEYERPADYNEMSDADKAAFDRKAEEAATTLPELKKGRMSNRDKQIAGLEQELRELKDSLKALRSPQSEATGGGEDNEPKTYFGVETWEEVRELADVDPKKYHAGMADMARDRSVAEQDQRSKVRQIEAEIVKDGRSLEEVKQFAAAKRIPDLSVAYDYFKLSAVKTPLVRIREQAPTTMPNRNGVTTPRKKTMEESIDDLLCGEAK